MIYTIVTVIALTTIVILSFLVLDVERADRGRRKVRRYVEGKWEKHKLAYHGHNQTAQEWIYFLTDDELPEQFQNYKRQLDTYAMDRKAFGYATTVFTDEPFIHAFMKLLAIWGEENLRQTFLKHLAYYQAETSERARNAKVTENVEHLLLLPIEQAMNACREKYTEYFRLLDETKENAFNLALSKPFGERNTPEQEKRTQALPMMAYMIPDTDIPTAEEERQTSKDQEQFEAILNGITRKK